ncbi:universal stress protein [Flagellimonas allohymeniacidonis]|uniref:universal stress protein n=1 Tax=Flagellimonas allohymeniacidonis TaxID=2517819 RepID=UPI0013EEBCFC|nr:universal stress protein [Allomuricauda hymeniacidonis]
MKHILLPTDFSANALKAMHYAVALFENEKTTFYVLHAHSFESGSKMEAQQNLQLSTEELRNYKPNPKHLFEPQFLEEPLFIGIEPLIIKKDIDFIVMGTKGSSALKELFMGSRAVKMIETIRYCPILMVPDAYELAPLSRFMIATNFDHYYERIELAPIIGLAKDLKVKIDVVHIIEEKTLSDYQEKLKQLLKKKLFKLDYAFEEISSKGTLQKTITSLAKEREVNLLAMTHHRYGFWKEFFSTRVIKKIAFDISVPFLVLPEVD